jgi:hypothetical protein
VWVGVGCIAVIAVLAVWNVLASHVLHGEVTARSLFLSVEAESGGGDPFERDRHSVCERTAAAGVASWTCDVADQGGSPGVATYRVDVHGSCWDAIGGSRYLPRKLSGCVHLQEG